MKIYLRKVDDTLIPELVEIDIKKLQKRRVKLEDLYIFLDDFYQPDNIW